MLYTCKRCGCHCDPGELTNWVCDSCIKDEERERARQAAFDLISDAPGVQMSLFDFLGAYPPRKVGCER